MCCVSTQEHASVAGHASDCLQKVCSVWLMRNFKRCISRKPYGMNEAMILTDRGQEYNVVLLHALTGHSAAQHSAAQHSTAQHSTAQHSTAQRSATQRNTAQHSRCCPYLQATAKFKLFKMTKVYMLFLPTPGLYRAGDITLKKTATA